MLKKFKMEDCKPVTTSMTFGCKLFKYDESPKFDDKLYKSMIGELNFYLGLQI